MLRHHKNPNVGKEIKDHEIFRFRECGGIEVLSGLGSHFMSFLAELGLRWLWGCLWLRGSGTKHQQPHQ